MFTIIMSSSDVSSSDSDTDCDDGVGESVKAVFNAMKQKLSSVSVANAEKERKRKVFTSKHKRIYQTFDGTDSDSESDVSESNVPPGDNENTNTCEDTIRESVAFFIDKGPVGSSLVADSEVNSESENTLKEKDDVTTFDLSNLAEDVSAQDDVTDNQSRRKGNDGQKMKEKHAKKRKKKQKSNALSSELQSGLKMKDVYVNVNPYDNPKTKQNMSKFIQKHKEPEVMKKCVINDDFEKQDSIATTHISVRQMKRERKAERAKTKGDKWYNIPCTEVSDERKHDIAVLKMRKALDPKRFYKANDMKTMPKYFQFGKVVEDPTDFYSSRIPKKQRKSTIVEELLADSNFRQYNKRKYEEVQEAKRLGKGPYQHMKRLKKRKK